MQCENPLVRLTRGKQVLRRSFPWLRTEKWKWITQTMCKHGHCKKEEKQHLNEFFCYKDQQRVRKVTCRSERTSKTVFQRVFFFTFTNWTFRVEKTSLRWWVTWKYVSILCKLLVIQCWHEVKPNGCLGGRQSINQLWGLEKKVCEKQCAAALKTVQVKK